MDVAVWLSDAVLQLVGGEPRFTSRPLREGHVAAYTFVRSLTVAVRNRRVAKE